MQLDSRCLGWARPSNRSTTHALDQTKQQHHLVGLGREADQAGNVPGLVSFRPPSEHREKYYLASRSQLVYVSITVNQPPKGTFPMSIPSNGITPEVIRGAMAPYLLSLDLLHATFAALPAPPPNATPAWRRARVTRLAAEIVAPMPAHADQASISAQSLIFRELANTFSKDS